MENIRVSQIPDEAVFVSVDYDVAATKEYLGIPPDDDTYASFFVIVGDGEYLRVWGLEYSVPWLEVMAWEIVVP